MPGELLGFKASKLFIKGSSVTTLDIPQTSYIQKFVEKGDLGKAFQLACLGVGEAEWMSLGVEAMMNGEFEVA